jgi:hypothetical protein
MRELVCEREEPRNDSFTRLAHHDRLIVPSEIVPSVGRVSKLDHHVFCDDLQVQVESSASIECNQRTSRVMEDRNGGRVELSRIHMRRSAHCTKVRFTYPEETCKRQDDGIRETLGSELMSLHQSAGIGDV